jgi:hypothetical protein
MDEIVLVNREALMYDSMELVDLIFANSVSRRVFPVIEDLRINQKRFKYEKVYGDLKTNYRMTDTEHPRNHSALQPVDVKVPMIGTATEYTYHEYLDIEMPESKMKVGEREMEVMKQWAVDEDMYAIAGESTWNGVPGISDTTNFSEAATTELDLTSLTTLKTSLNAIISQLNNNLNGDSGGQTVKMYPLIALMTSDVEDRLYALLSALEDDVDGYDIFNGILTKRGGPNSEILVSNALGATVTKDGDSFYISTAGTTNFALMAWSSNHFGMRTSPRKQRPKLDEQTGYLNLIDGRLVSYSKRTNTIIYSGTVDITS